MSRESDVVIVGGGLAGSLLALLLARRGYGVDVYELRPDLRQSDAPGGRSINLALSERGLHALRLVGLEEEILALTIPMRGRMIHDQDGQMQLQPYGQKEHEVIRAVSRADLNRRLLKAAGREKGIRLHFTTACEQIDLSSGRIQFRSVTTSEDFATDASVIFGADGAGSVVRQAMVSQAGVETASEFLPHGYKELTIPPNEDGSFRMDARSLHIWPRGSFMLIALPNQDGSFTCTLFLQQEGRVSFGSLNDESAVRAFFETEFGDAAALMPTLVQDFFTNPTGVLGTVRCDRWNVGGKALILGDAAHAIVPFFGQGMNSAFEDCAVLDACIEAAHEGGPSSESEWANVFDAFTERRIPDANAIADMALDNYIEMRDRVADPAFQLRRAVGFEMERRMPERFIPKYSLVSFHRVPYAEAQRIGEIQNRLLHEVCDGRASLEDIDWDLAERLVRERL